MSQSNASNTKELKLALSALELQVELYTQQRYRWKDGPKQTALLLQCAMDSQHKGINSALKKAALLFSEKQRQSLAQYGVDLSSFVSTNETGTTMTYRGSKVVKPDVASQESVHDEPSAENKGKRKIIYRGQVKWID